MSRTSSAGSRWSRPHARRAQAIVGGATLVVVVVLGLFAVQLQSTQRSSHERVVSRFRDRAQVVSALTQALLASAAPAPETTRQYGGATVSPRVLDRTVAQGHLSSAVLLDARGRTLAASTGASPAAQAAARSSAAVRAVRAGARVAIGDVVPGPVPTIHLAAALDTAAGRRVLVSAAPAAALGALLGGYLERVPTRGGTAYLLDAHGTVVGARDARATAGRPVGEPGLAAAAAHGDDGTYGRAGYYVAVGVPGSTWRVVLTSTRASLFSSVTGARKWLPWIILAALGLTALGLVALLHRLARHNLRLQGTNALLRHAAELARSNAELEQFASIASHDLQEPLRKVQTFAAQIEATEGERLSEQGQDFLRRMSGAAGRMRALIDDLLTFSRVSTQGGRFVPVNLEATVALALDDLEAAIEERGARIAIGPLPTLEGDPLQLRQLLQNLLGNALKFQRPGVTPEIAVRASVAGGVAELTVSDNGLGFDAQFATRIFRAFERLHGASAYPGTGIGLALCRKIVERHHGTITADGREGAGATFTVRLPVRQPAAPDPPSALFPEPSEEADHALA